MEVTLEMQLHAVFLSFLRTDNFSLDQHGVDIFDFMLNELW